MQRVQLTGILVSLEETGVTSTLSGDAHNLKFPPEMDQGGMLIWHPVLVILNRAGWRVELLPHVLPRPEVGSVYSGGCNGLAALRVTLATRQTRQWREQLRRRCGFKG